MRRLAWIAAAVIPACASVTTEPAPTEPASTERAIVFAADFDSNGGCKDRSTTDQCDLYTAQLELADGSVQMIERATSTAQSESYPAWHPDGQLVYFTVLIDQRTKDIGFVDLARRETGVVVDHASWPEVHPDGTTLLYTDAGDLLTTATLSADRRSVSSPASLTGVKDQHDADYSPDGRFVVFHEIANSMAVGQVYDTSSAAVASWGQASGHCAFGGGGTLTVCDHSAGGGIFSKELVNGSLGAGRLYLPDPEPAEIAIIDDVFRDCNGVSFNYPTPCGDDDHLLVSASCNRAGVVTFSRLFLVDLSTAAPTVRPIGKALAAGYGGAGTSSWTVSCR